MLETDRLLLRLWSEEDREPFARLNSDPRVMEYFPNRLSRPESDLFFDRIQHHFRMHSFGLYAVELRTDGQFIGFVGLQIPAFQAHFTPCVEIGWRLSAESWGHGLATEGARAVAKHAFEIARLDSIVSFAVPANLRSRRVMEKIGMSYNPSEDFDHPNLPEEHPLRRHVLYRLARKESRPSSAAPSTLNTEF